MIGFELQRPELVWLLLLAPMVLLFGIAGLARSRVELARWVIERARERFLPGASSGRSRLRLLLGVGGILFLGLAALGPVRGHTYRSVSRKGLDLVVCLDTSRSMLAQDLRPSRLERAKREIIGLLDRLRGDRVALVAFSGDARDIAPLTRDRETLLGLLSYVTPDDNREGGTNLAAAIEHALALFDGRTGAHEAVVLLTDGEDLAGEAATQAAEAARRGIRLFVVGVGTEVGGKIPVVDGTGNASFLRDAEGQEVVTKLDRASLVALAERTGGDYLSAEESPTALEDLYRARITRMQGREIEGGERRVPYDRFQWPLALALVFLLGELALQARPRRAHLPSRSATRLASALLPLLPLTQSPQGPVPTLADVVFHHRAGEAPQAAEAARAVLANADALGLGELERARAQYALGVIRATRALEGGEDADAAREEARAALGAARALAGPGDLRLDAVYDLGTLELFHAEAVRATLPEISGQPPAPPAGLPTGPSGLPPPGGAGAGQAQPDPLQEARGLYGAAKGWFLERLRLDWRDEDTRADLELIQRRLKQLDEIERQREEQKQQQQDQNQDQNKDQQSQDQQDQKDQQEQQDQQDQDGESKQNPDQKPGEDSKPDEQDQEQDEKQDSQEEKNGEDEREGEQEPQDQDGQQPEQAQPQEGQDESHTQPAETVLTREQVMQLLDKLQELEKKQQALEAALRARRRAATKRDW